MERTENALETKLTCIELDERDKRIKDAAFKFCILYLFYSYKWKIRSINCHFSADDAPASACWNIDI